MTEIPVELNEIFQDINSGKGVGSHNVRIVLKWFGYERRGANVLQRIEEALDSLGLATEPPFSDAGIDESVRFRLRTTISDGSINLASSAHAPAVSFLESVSQNTPGFVVIATEDQLEPEDEDDDEPAGGADDRPVTSKINDWTISALRDKLERGSLDLQPKFQRQYVWDTRPELPSRLIESLFLEIPVPPIYFGKVSEGRLEVIDGQQRLTTLINYVTNKFPLKKLYRMSSLNGKHFKDLTHEQQEKILDAPIRSIVIDAAGNAELRYEVFERLNRGSMPLNEQELRNCLYRGPFNDMLAGLESENYWRKVKGGVVPEGRFKEREMILRLFAFANRLSQYAGNLKRFLNDYMANYAPRDEQALKNDSIFFRQTMQNVYAVFGDKAARLYVVDKNNNGFWDNKFSIAALDIQFAALMNRTPSRVQAVAEQIRERFLFVLLTDQEVQDAISKRTSSTVQTMVRWKKFRDLVDPILEGSVVEQRFFSFEFRKELYDSSPVCAICGNQIHTFEDSSVDHIHPYSKGGKTDPKNGQLAHKSCNARKSDAMPK